MKTGKLYYIHDFKIHEEMDQIDVDFCNKDARSELELGLMDSRDLVMHEETIDVEDIVSFIRENHLNEFRNDDGYEYMIDAKEMFLTEHWREQAFILVSYLEQEYPKFK